MSLTDELGFFLRKHRVMVVLDEAHKIKNTNGGIIAQSILSLAQDSKARVVLTGTPAYKRI
ncbi:MAG: SNF2-related protein [Candidatus Syntrophopropionicum ammoniitolerans]